MEILIIICILVQIFLTFYLIMSIKNEKKSGVIKPQEEKLTDEQRKRQEELKKAFDNLMNYDYNEALKKKEWYKGRQKTGIYMKQGLNIIKRYMAPIKTIMMS